MYEERFCQCLKENEVLIGPPLYWGLYTLQKTRFGAAFLKKCSFRVLFVKRSSTTGCIAAFTKRGYRPALKLRLVSV